MLSKFNANQNAFSDITGVKEMGFVTLKSLHESKESEWPIDGFYFHTGRYGRECVLISMSGKTKFRANVPAHMIPVMDAIMENEEAVASIKAGKEKFKVRAYNTKKGAEAYTIDFV